LKAIQIQAFFIEHFGWTKGLKNLPALEVTLSQPFASFNGVDLYLCFSEKAAALIESNVVNHPFIDWNDRPGFVLMSNLV
jgi:death-on-curing protein